MKKIVFNTLMTVLISLSAILVLTNPKVVNAADSSIGQSNATVSFFGQSNPGNTGGETGTTGDDGSQSNPGSGGYDDNGFVRSQSTLPQTGEIQVANLSVLGYLLLAFASILFVEKRMEKTFNK